MSALGEYVHLHAENYLKYGTNRIHAGVASDSAASAYQQQLQRNRQRLERLAAQSSAIAPNLKILETYIANEARDEELREERALNRYYSRNFQNAEQRIVDFFTNAVPATIEGRTIKRRNPEIKEPDIYKAMQVRRRIYEQINRMIKLFNQGKTASPQSINNLIQNFDDFFSLVKRDDIKEVYIKSDLNSKNTLVKLKELLRKFNLNAAIAEANGIWGEKVVALAGQKLQQQVNNSIEQSLNSLIVGDARTSFSLDKSMFGEDVGSILEKKYNNIYRAIATQDKVDVNIQLDDGDINASVKAYTPRDGMIKPHLQDVSLMYQLLSTQNNFANHWLNCQCLYNQNMSINRTRTELDAVLLEQMKYEALVHGNMLKQNVTESNVFVAIDVIQGRVYVKTAYDILTDNNAFELSQTMNDLMLYEYNTFEQQGVAYRIANIIQGLRQKQIGFSLSIQFKK